MMKISGQKAGSEDSDDTLQNSIREQIQSLETRNPAANITNDDNHSLHGAPTSCLDSVDGEEKEAFELFPFLVWAKVLHYLNSEDKYQLSNVCKTFDFWLKPDLCTWVFDKIIPLVESYLPTKDLRNCRRVCKRWATVINEFFYQKIHAHANNKYLIFPFRLAIGGIVDNTDNDRLRLLAQDENYLRNPAVGKFVKICGRATDQFPNTMKTMLQSILPALKNAWYFQLQYYQSHLECYKTLRKCIPHLTRVRNLVIWNVDHTFTPKKLDELQVYIRDHPLPKPALGNLETIEMDAFLYYGKITVDPIRQALIASYCDQIRILKTQLELVQNDELHQLVNLQELYLEILTAENLNNFAGIFERTKGLPLKKLVIEGKKDAFNYLLQYYQFPVEYILGSICHFPLQHLDIICPDNDNWCLSGGESLLPNVIRFDQLSFLTIEDHHAMSFNILLSMPALKDLNIYNYVWPKCICPMCRERRRTVHSRAGGGVGYKGTDILDIRKYLYDDRLYDSNIWEKFTNLERVSVEMDHPYQHKQFNYTRVGYKEYQRWERNKVLVDEDLEDDGQWEDIN